MFRTNPTRAFDLENEKTVKLVRDLERVRPPGFVEVYANHADGAFGFHDLRLVFGQIVAGLDKPYVEERAAVTMNWEHVKSLRDLLGDLLEQYEEQHGTIRTQHSEPD